MGSYVRATWNMLASKKDLGGFEDRGFQVWALGFLFEGHLEHVGLKKGFRSFPRQRDSNMWTSERENPYYFAAMGTILKKTTLILGTSKLGFRGNRV